MKVYGPYTRSDGRQHVILYDGVCRKTISYPKYLLEQKLGRQLTEDETCDHIDNDYTNNDISNLQILSRADNIKKAQSLMPKQIGTFTCPICNSSFTKEMRHVSGNRKQGKRGPYCSRSCAGKAGRRV